MTAGQHAAPSMFRRFRVWPRPAVLVDEPAAEVPAQAAPAEVADHDATSPGFPLPAPDDTMVWRGPGMVIPPATLETPEEPLPARVPGAAIPAASVPALRNEPADPAILRKVRDGLKPRPVSWLRVIEDDGRQAHEALDGPPEFAGTVAMPDGTPVAGLVLGCHGRGTWIFDTADPAEAQAVIDAATAMRDALLAAQGDEPEGEAA